MLSDRRGATALRTTLVLVLSVFMMVQFQPSSAITIDDPPCDAEHEWNFWTMSDGYTRQCQYVDGVGMRWVLHSAEDPPCAAPEQRSGRLWRDSKGIDRKCVRSPFSRSGYRWVPVRRGPAIDPAEQVTAGDGVGIYDVTVPEDPSQRTTVLINFGDGTWETRPIPQGSYFVVIEFKHTFNVPGSYIQTARIVETGAEALPAMTAALLPGSVPNSVFPAPLIDPPVQLADSNCSATYSVSVLRQTDGDLTLLMEYGDGASEVRVVTQGEGVATFYFSHVFSPLIHEQIPPEMSSELRTSCTGSPPESDSTAASGDPLDIGAREPRDNIDISSRGSGVYIQKASVVETTASTSAVTVHPL